MSRKRILNISSTKKRDNMMSWTGVGTTVSQGPYNMIGKKYNANIGAYIVPWIATARDMTIGNPGDRPAPGDKATRTATTCYMKGLSETIKFYTTTSLPWEWRRICFTFKGDLLSTTNTNVRIPLWFETSAGYGRYNLGMTSLDATADQQALIGKFLVHMFDGSYGSDYSDVMLGKVNRTMLHVEYDRTISLKSPNDAGLQTVRRLWHPMNKNIVYDDFESGGRESSGTLSTEGRPGMGDYYVVDIFKPHPNATDDDRLQFHPQACLYWHEK